MEQVPVLDDRVESAAAPRCAPQQPPGGLETADEQAVRAKSPDRVLGAGRDVAASRTHIFA
jgi:hypothetical protein